MQNNPTTPTNPAQPSFQDDEIDLFELWNGLVAEKWTVVISFLITTVLAATYAFTATPIYKSTSYLLPPLEEQLLTMKELQILLSNSNSNSLRTEPETVFEKYLTNLSSRQNLKTIFNQYELIYLYQPDFDTFDKEVKMKGAKKAFNEFVSDFSLNRPKKNSADKSVSVSLSLALSELKVAEIVNKLVDLAKQQTVNQLFQQVISEKSSFERYLNNKISSSRKVALDRRHDRIAQLKEAIEITHKLGIKKPVTSGPTLNVNNVNVQSSQSAVLYLLGSDLLEAEKAVLQARKNDDAFITDLRSYQEVLQRLKSFNIDKSDIGVVTIDQPATYGEKIKPKKALILAVGGVLGLMLGVFIALIRRAVKNRKAETAPA